MTTSNPTSAHRPNAPTAYSAEGTQPARLRGGELLPRDHDGESEQGAINEADTGQERRQRPVVPFAHRFREGAIRQPHTGGCDQYRQRQGPRPEAAKDPLSQSRPWLTSQVGRRRPRRAASAHLTLDTRRHLHRASAQAQSTSVVVAVC